MGIEEIISTYDKKNISLATVCSHSSLQIFNGAKREGFKSIGIAIKKQPAFYDAFPLGKPDEYIIIDIEKLRNSGLLETPRKDIFNSDGSAFKSYKLNELYENHCIIRNTIKYDQ